MATRAAGRQRQIKAKQTEDMVAFQQMEQERQKRLQEKKKRAEERKKEEDLQKQKEDEDRKAAASAEAIAAGQVVSPGDAGQQDQDMADPGINRNLAAMMQGDMEEEPTEQEGRDETASPVKNKQKKSYVETAAGAAATVTAAKAKGVTTNFDSHIHKHQRVIVEASIKLTGANPTQEFIVNLQELLKNGQLVDKFFAFTPVKPDGGEKKIHEASGVPTNMTMLGAHFKISSNGRNPFEKQKVWGNKSKKNNKEEFKDPIVYFTLAIATDEDPEELLARIIHEWQRRGGILLRIKGLQSFETETVLILFSICTAVPKKLILDKFCTILTQAQSFSQEDDFSEFNWNQEELPQNSTLPAMEIRLQNPKLPGQDTSEFSKLSWRVQACRKVYHVECDQKFASDIKRLAQVAKEANFVTKMWGKHAHITEVVDKSSTPSEIKRLVKVSMRHTNYNNSMLVEDVQGITDLDVPVEIYQEGTTKCLGSLSLRQAMLNYLKMSDGHQLIAEVHQASSLVGSVHIVVPNSPEAERMVMMMNKNFPAYVGNVLKDQGLPESYLFELVKRLCCPVMVAEISQCKWDQETCTLSTRQDDKNAKNNEDLENAPWFKDAFAGLGLAAKDGAGKKQAPPPETLFDLDGDRSIKTIHHRNEEKPNEGAGSTPPRKGKGIIEVVDDFSEEDTDGDSESSSENQERPRAAANVRGDAPPTSSDEEDGKAPGAADGG